MCKVYSRICLESWHEKICINAPDDCFYLANSTVLQSSLFVKVLHYKIVKHGFVKILESIKSDCYGLY